MSGLRYNLRFVVLALVILVLVLAASLVYVGFTRVPSPVTTTMTVTETEVVTERVTTVTTYTTRLTYTTQLVTTRVLTETKVVTETVVKEYTVVKKYPLEVVDALGRIVRVESVPRRVVSLAPSITEMLFALGVGEYIVGVDKYSNYPPEIVKLREEGKVVCVGGYWNPDLEKIVKLQPDLVVAGVGAHAKLLDKFNELGLKVIYVHGGIAANVRDIVSDIQLLGLVFNVTDRASKLSEEILNYVKDISAKIEEAKKANKTTVKRVLVLLGPPSMGLWSTGSGTFIDYLIKVAGGVNILSKYHGWIQVGYEEIIKADPEVIIITVMGTREDALKILEEVKNSPLNATSAVRSGRVYVLIGEADDVLCRPGPRITIALDILVRILHPKVFGEVERDDVITYEHLESYGAPSRIGVLVGVGLECYDGG